MTLSTIDFLAGDSSVTMPRRTGKHVVQSNSQRLELVTLDVPSIFVGCILAVEIIALHKTVIRFFGKGQANLLIFVFGEMKNSGMVGIKYKRLENIFWWFKFWPHKRRWPLFSLSPKCWKGGRDNKTHTVLFTSYVYIFYYYFSLFTLVYNSIVMYSFLDVFLLVLVLFNGQKWFNFSENNILKKKGDKTAT